MRLIDVKTLQLRTFKDSEIPPYAALTHTWGADEATFYDITRHDGQAKLGSKIRECCRKAIEDNIDYAWIDTCCIDKSSSAELSEAINSMFRWYGNAARCFAYLFDVRCRPGDPSFEAEFAACRWFTRGWTLQELIAPEDVRFFNAHWELIGSKQSLAEVIARITGVSKEVLLARYVPSFMQSISIATRMSWAANRETEKPEDMAYCLLGLFGVNMPLLYGEGRNAFLRLQEEILKNSEDHSLFAWDMPLDMARNRGLWRDSFGILAPWPSFFAGSGHITLIQAAQQRSSHRMTNMGLKIELPILPAEEEGKYIALLQCQFDHITGDRIGITLIRNRDTGKHWRTSSPIQSISMDESNLAKCQKIYISKGVYQPSRPRYRTCWINAASIESHGFEITEVYAPRFLWDKATHAMRIPCESGASLHQAVVRLSKRDADESDIVILLTIYQQDQGFVRVLSSPHSSTLAEHLLETSPVQVQHVQDKLTRHRSSSPQ